MRRRVVLLSVLLAVLVIAGCQKKQETVTPGRRVITTNIPQNEAGKRARVLDRVGTAVIEKMLVGIQLAPDGNVNEQQTVVPAGDPVYVTLRLHDSPVGLRTGATWYGEHDQIIAREQKDMNGAKVATFALGQKLAPGKYHVRGYWGGNIADDRNFVVVAKSKK
ncbi:MAG TPA: hypothetical protein VHX14_01210 [Thermoanaerobaculia bacterium]|jgi:hypothetical protein|nr:hypothetical protein [Thermoanaerobaculia bacterium]